MKQGTPYWLSFSLGKAMANGVSPRGSPGPWSWRNQWFVNEEFQIPMELIALISFSLSQLIQIIQTEDIILAGGINICILFQKVNEDAELSLSLSPSLFFPPPLALSQSHHPPLSLSLFWNSTSCADLAVFWPMRRTQGGAHDRWPLQQWKTPSRKSARLAVPKTPQPVQPGWIICILWYGGGV